MKKPSSDSNTVINARQVAERLNVSMNFEPAKDAPWGERFLHVADPDGHELSFAEPLPARI